MMNRASLKLLAAGRAPAARQLGLASFPVSKAAIGKPRPPPSTSLVRFYSTQTPEEKAASTPRVEPPDIKDAIGTDLHKAKAAFALTTVPREAYALGLSGTVPFFATSLATVYLGWVIRQGPGYPTMSPAINTFLVSQDTAQQWLQLLEPVQLGYGAVIISFLGAVHWGMELSDSMKIKHVPADEGRKRFRYAMGVLAPAAAWPTLFMPVHFALTGQFLAFTMLYFADSRATVRGWAPSWYAPYRFVLTAVVGSAIVVSLLFRAKIDDAGENMAKRLEQGKHTRGPVEEPYTSKWAKREAEEKAKRRAEKAAEEKKAKESTKSGQSGSKEGKPGEDEDETETGEENATDGKPKSDEPESKDKAGESQDEPKEKEKSKNEDKSESTGDKASKDKDGK